MEPSAGVTTETARSELRSHLIAVLGWGNVMLSAHSWGETSRRAEYADACPRRAEEAVLR